MPFDFGFESRGARFEAARVAFIFVVADESCAFGKTSGPLAIADASRYAEFYDVETGAAPLAIGVCAEVAKGPNGLTSTLKRAQLALAKGIVPVVIGIDRQVTCGFKFQPIVALWGNVGRQEINEAALFKGRPSAILGVRAATCDAIPSLPQNVTITTSRDVRDGWDELTATLTPMPGPVHLSIDLDVLAPAVAQTPRSLEPGGLSWYQLIDAMEMVFSGPGVGSVDVVGTGGISPRSPAALLGAQILLKIAGFVSSSGDR
ncbi:MAG: arginase family protein [Myxococcota bacterium]|nr:arginase family protein [Myxococcota bacterium]